MLSMLYISNSIYLTVAQKYINYLSFDRNAVYLWQKDISLNDLHCLCYTARFHRVFHLQFGKYLLAVTANRVFADG